MKIYIKSKNIEGLDEVDMLEFCDNYIKEDLDIIEKRLNKVVLTDQPLLVQVVKYFTEAKGKRLRPTAILLTGRLGHYHRERLVSLATAIEILHMATLVHDDIIDSSLIRHGRETVHTKWNKTVGLLLGDYFYAKSMGMLSQLFPVAMQEVVRAIVSMVEGEMEQQQDAYNLDIDEERYFSRIRKKTASLIRACCKLGGYSAGLRGKRLEALEKYGEYLGMAFQIRDDYLDYYGTPKTTGKPVGNDFYQGVVTLPLIHYIKNNNLGTKEKNVIREIMKGNPTYPDEAGCNVFKSIQASGSLDYSIKVAEGYTRKALEQLELITPCPAREGLRNLVEFTLRRVH